MNNTTIMFFDFYFYFYPSLKMNTMCKKVIILLALVVTFSSCKVNIPDDVQLELNKMSSSNQKKFEKIIHHFGGKKNELKLKATFFIIENINDFGFYSGTQLDQYNALFEVLAAKPEDYKDKLPWYSTEIDKIFDSLELVYGKLDPKMLYYKKDVDAFTVKSFIQYIDDAFEAWQNPWSQSVSFNDFCEYILPYRLGSEPLENWRPMFIKRYGHVLDSLPANATRVQVGKLLNDDTKLKYATGLGRYITAIAPSNMIKSRFGSCADMSTYKALVMRSFGIPVCTDFFPQWGNDHNNHYWNGMMDQKGVMISMDSVIGDRNSWVAYKYQIAKVYRKTFSKQPQMLALQKFNRQDIPPLFQDVRLVDVTDKYIAVSDYEFSTKTLPADVPLVYLCVFNDHGFTPIAFGQVVDQKVKFTDIGRNVLFFPMYIKNQQFNPAGVPFVIDSNEAINYKYPADKSENITLTRKYYMHERKVDWLRCLVKGQFQGANSADFSDAKTLASIQKIPSQHKEELKVRATGAYKFYRFLFDPSELELEYDDAGASISEIEFMDVNGNILKGKPMGTDPKNYSEYTPDKCFDGNVLSFFEDPGKT